MSEPRSKLVCFAVKEEARYFSKIAASRPGIEVLITGMGHRNAGQALRSRLLLGLPALVVSSGFAGGLRPGLQSGTVLFAGGPGSVLAARCRAAGMVAARFLGADTVASTAARKAELWRTTGADAVEMESESLCAVCRDYGVPCAVIRVILDPAEEDLPLDFNEVLGPDARLRTGKLAWRLARSPRLVPALLRLQRQSAAAAQSLAQSLGAIL